jgi:hypothetical protein
MISLKEFFIGARVQYVDGKYGASQNNPLQGTKYACDGTVYDMDDHTIYVKWDNGVQNDYSYNTLIVINTKNPNLLFRLKKKSWVK